MPPSGRAAVEHGGLRVGVGPAVADDDEVLDDGATGAEEGTHIKILCCCRGVLKVFFLRPLRSGASLGGLPNCILFIFAVNVRTDSRCG